MSSVTEFVGRVNAALINPLIGFLFAAALALFTWGIVQFLTNAENEEARATGKRHMLWGIIGMFIMVSVFGILRVVTSTFGVSLP
jgi:hypothetical protein